MKKVITLATALGLVVASATVAEMNPVIFASKVVANLPGITEVDGKYYRMDTKANTSVEVTATQLQASALAALKAGKDDTTGSINIAEDFGLIGELVLERDTDKTVFGSASIADTAKALGLKVLDVSVDAQHAVIFNAKGLQNIGGLTKSDDKHFILDTAKNTATLINPEKVAEQAIADLLKGKNTDFTRLAESFCLVSKVTLGTPSAPAAD